MENKLDFRRATQSNLLVRQSVLGNSNLAVLDILRQTEKAMPRVPKNRYFSRTSSRSSAALLAIVDALVVLVLWSSFVHADVGKHVDLASSVPRKLQTDLRERFLREAPGAWNSLHSKITNFRTKIENNIRSESRGGKVRSSVTNWSFIVGDRPEKQLVVEEDGRTAAANGRYAFQVRRRTDGGPYQLEKAILKMPGSPQRLPGAALAQSSSFINSMWSVWWLPFEQIMNTEGFRLIAAEQGESGEEADVIRVAYRYEGPSVFPNLVPDALYWAEMVPARSWAVLRSGVVGLKAPSDPEPLNIRVTSQLVDIAPGIPVPSHIVMEYGLGKSKKIVEERETLLSIQNGPGHEEEVFYLPYYGISESSIPGLSTPSSGFRWLVALLGMGGVVLSIWLIMARRKQRKVEVSERP